ncbi:MAG: class I SAM-dependent methyltransferase [Candidatus Lokiarchaeota archaeon]|nr:class I SAM-dependent methyltransferase [Candidatus Lokiarchaeota archaeon]
MEYEKSINEQYQQSNLGTKILSKLKSEGVENLNSIKETLAPIEELHLRGRKATLELAQAANLNEKMKVLDIGCGFGGSARALVSNFGCNVTGIDLCEDFCRAADLINEHLGYTDNIKIQQGNALNMPFNNNSFDIIFIQHVLMNIKNKERIISEIHRLLNPKGRLALNTICAGSVHPIHFPVIWANTPDISFLLSPNDLRQLIGTSGFKELLWRDDTKKVLEGIQNMRSKQPSNKPRPISLDLIIADTRTKWKNIVSNLKEGRIVVIQGVFERS